MKGYVVNLKKDGSDFGYLCTSCGLLLRDPRQTPCGHRYCKSCVQELTRGWAGRCAASDCGEEVQHSEVWPDKAVEREVLGIAILCNNAENGCTWEGAVRQLMAHLSDCDLEKIDCVNAGQGCQAHIPRKSMDNHLQYVCEYRHMEGEMQHLAARQKDNVGAPVLGKTLKDLGNKIAKEEGKLSNNQARGAEAATPPNIEASESRVSGLMNQIDEQERAINELMTGTAEMETRMEVAEKAVWIAFDKVKHLNHEVEQMREEDRDNKALIASLQSRIEAMEKRDAEQDAQLARQNIIIKTLEGASLAFL